MMIVGRGARALLVGCCAALTLVGCSSVDDAGACANLLGSLDDGAAAISAAAADPATAGDELRAFAEDLRTAADGAGGEIAAAADDLATAYEDIAARIENGEVPGPEEFEPAAVSLREACT